MVGVSGGKKVMLRHPTVWNTLLNGKRQVEGVAPQHSCGSALIDTAMLSEIISRIYDCAIAPEGWQRTLRMICDSANFRCATIYLLDRQTRLPLIRECTGVPSDWVEQYYAQEAQFGAEIHSVRTKFFEPLSIDEPQVLSRDVPREVYLNTRYFNDWMRPQGIVDIMQLLMMRKHDRHGAISFGRHERWGPFGERDMVLARLLQPHLRRAMAISNLLEVQTLRANNFRTVIGSLSTGIILVAENGVILETNAAAEQLLADGRIVCAVDGCLCGTRSDQSQLLHDAIFSAAEGTSSIVSSGITLTGAETGTVTAHILPLAGGDLRPNLRSTAVAAIFISPDANQYAKLPKAEILGVVYDLTAAERRVAEALADGKTSLQAAKALGISEATIRTHLTRIFTKTGVTRQAELISLMHRLALPLHGSAAPPDK